MMQSSERLPILLTLVGLLSTACSGGDGAAGDAVTAADASLADDDSADDDSADDDSADDDSADDDSADDDSADDDSPDDDSADDDSADDDSADDDSPDDDSPDGDASVGDAPVEAGVSVDASTGIDGGSGGSGSVEAGTGGAQGVDEPLCFPMGFSCQTSQECCSGLCDPTASACIPSLGQCTPEGQDCVASTECCGLSCVGGACSASCVSDGAPCSDDAECCGGVCDGTCVALNLECRTGGNSCSDGTECCSTLCGEDGTCDRSASYCVQSGDVCAQPTDCCSGVCTIAEGRQLGTCGAPPSGATNCTGIHGTVCNSCGECCSSLCAPYGPTGVDICQPPSGCHVSGELCRQDSDCCGGVPPEDYASPEEVLPGAGTVYCDIRDNNDLGVCRNPIGCSPQGNICHLRNYECSNSSAPANCCGAVGSMSGACQVDVLGVPRCNTIAECRDAGEVCSSAADCCNGVPCVPSDDGFLRCLPVDDDDPACVQAGSSCTSAFDCCPGSTCLLEPGSVAGVCGDQSDPPGGGGSPGSGGSPSGGSPSGGSPSGGSPSGGSPSTGGTPGAGGAGEPACSEYGQLCGAAQTCCNGVPCTSGRCVFPPN